MMRGPAYFFMLLTVLVLHLSVTAVSAQAAKLRYRRPSARGSLNATLRVCAPRNAALIFLLAPTSTDARMAQVARIASGYVYYVSLKGVTGSGALDTEAVKTMLLRIRQHLTLPLGVGFGIRDAATACVIAQVADAVVIGSRIIELIDHQPKNLVCTMAQAFLSDIRSALDSSTLERLHELA